MISNRMVVSVIRNAIMIIVVGILYAWFKGYENFELKYLIFAIVFVPVAAVLIELRWRPLTHPDEFQQKDEKDN